MNEFHDKVVVITGAASGIGEGIAKAFAKQHACLSLIDKNEINLERVSQECREMGSKKVVQIKADLSKVEEVKGVMDKTLAQFEKIDVLCNNAGIGSMDTVTNMNIEKFDLIFNINLKAPVYLTHLAVPHLEKTKGCVINTSSVAGSGVLPGCSLYSMTKAALIQFTKTSALELAEKGIRVNCISPSAVETNFDLGVGPDLTMKIMRAQRGVHPLGGKNISVTDVSNAVLYLSSEKSKVITGSNLNLDRGLLLTMKEMPPTWMSD